MGVKWYCARKEDTVVQTDALAQEEDEDEDEENQDHDVGPNVPVSEMRRGTPIASSVFCQTVLPHHVTETPPFGYWTAKNMTTRQRATPASSAAERI